MQRAVQLALRKVLAALGVAAAVTVAMAAGTAIAATSEHPGTMAATSAKSPCPVGYVCLYPGINSGGIPALYYRYGVYNLRNQFGFHLIVNNQTGGAAFRLCLGYNGQRCGGRLGPGYYYPNLTPINSIVLER
jgi:hypothetical protein